MEAQVSSAAQAMHNEELCNLLRNVARGDEEALAILYKRLSRMIYAFSLRRLSDTAAAEEVVVETMYEVWKGAARFAGRSMATTWILGIARHKALDKLRSRGANLFESLDDDVDSVADDQPSVYELIAGRQQAGQIALCMEALPDVQRECIHLVFYEDTPLAEVASLQGCPENTVKTRLFHARRKMKSCLDRQVRRMGAA